MRYTAVRRQQDNSRKQPQKPMPSPCPLLVLLAGLSEAGHSVRPWRRASSCPLVASFSMLSFWRLCCCPFGVVRSQLVLLLSSWCVWVVFCHPFLLWSVVLLLSCCLCCCMLLSKAGAGTAHRINNNSCRLSCLGSTSAYFFNRLPEQHECMPTALRSRHRDALKNALQGFKTQNEDFHVAPRRPPPAPGSLFHC